MIYEPQDQDRLREEEAHLKGDARERLRSLERELRRAQQMYDIVVGFQGRIKWRREIEGVQTEIRKVLEQNPLETVEASVEVEARALSGV